MRLSCRFFIIFVFSMDFSRKIFKIVPQNVIIPNYEMPHKFN